MNEYKIIVKGTDPLGISFLKNIVELASKGAVLLDNPPVHNRFPHSAVLEISTEEELVTDMRKGIQVVPRITSYTRDQLEEMEWDKLKTICKRIGIGGRDRNLMVTKYLQALGKELDNEAAA